MPLRIIPSIHLLIASLWVHAAPGRMKRMVIAGIHLFNNHFTMAGRDSSYSAVHFICFEASCCKLANASPCGIPIVKGAASSSRTNKELKELKENSYLIPLELWSCLTLIDIYNCSDFHKLIARSIGYLFEI